MKQAIADLLSSKKGIVFVTSAIIVLTKPLLAKLGYEIDETTLIEFLTISGGYLIAQGVTDHGKEAAAITADAALAAKEPLPLEKPDGAA